MSKTKIQKSIAVVAILIMCLFTFPIVSSAANVTTNVGKTTLNVGETTTYTVKANNCAGRFSMTSSDASVVAIEGTTSEYLDNTSLSVTLRAKKSGTATITVKYIAADYDTGIDDENSKSVKITVKDPTPPPNNGGGNSGSGDNNLKSITVAGKKYTNPSTDFTVNVEAGVTSAEVSAEASHGSAKISGTGRKELSTGTNTVSITVTAENGAKKTYNVRIRRLADTSNQTPNKTDNQNNNQQPTEPDNQPEEPTAPELLRLTYLLIEDVELTPEFNSEVFEYTANVINKDSLEIVKVVNKEDAVVEITGDKELVDGENIVIIKLTKEDEVVEYKITVNKKTETVVTAEPENQEPEETEKGFWDNYKWSIIAGGIILVVVIVVVIVIIRANATDEMSERARRRMEKKREKHRGIDD